MVAEALIFVPLLYIANSYVPGAIEYAVVITLGGFAGLTGIAFITRKDFSFLRAALMWGFGAAGIGMIFGLFTFMYGQKYLMGHAEPADPGKLKRSFLGPINVEWSIYLLSLPVLGVLWLLVQHEPVVLLTQNVDGLHHAAGSRNVIDIHGDVLATLNATIDSQAGEANDLVLDAGTATVSFNFLSTGSLSPVSIDSSTADCPSTIVPSTGMRSPGRTITTISLSTFERAISFSCPFSRMNAVFGCSPISFLMALPVLPLVRAYNSLPSLIRVIMTAAVSK